MLRHVLPLLLALPPMVVVAQDGGMPVRQDADRGQALFDQGFRTDGDDRSTVPPSWPGGTEALVRTVRERMRYPAEALAAGVGGRVVVAFTVTVEGMPGSLRVLRPVHPLLDAEALRVVGTLTGWVPGSRNGVPTAMRMHLPVLFEPSP
ncbi:MAG: energy transducer TonB [Flavobacteriales bacterium]|nr:hypothetical protein [Flavobacteriales bacterium]MCC6577723.1 energy transducer TonB [Flavobacteriales bacterium]NUQ14484.1 energy transducer TonB [Flavobacteriales bacterium]